MGDERAVFDDLQRVQLPALFDMYGVNCVIDVGAHEGEYAKRLRDGGYGGRIVSFEPVPRAFAALERDAAGDPDWSVHPLALGREDGTTTMNVVPGTLSSLREPTEFGARRYKRLRDPESVDVEVRRLDGMLDELLHGLERHDPAVVAAGAEPCRVLALVRAYVDDAVDAVHLEQGGQLNSLEVLEDRLLVDHPLRALFLVAAT